MFGFNFFKKRQADPKVSLRIPEEKNANIFSRRGNYYSFKVRAACLKTGMNVLVSGAGVQPMIL